jgi:beta-glucosidase
MINVYDTINSTLKLTYCNGPANVYDPKEPSLSDLSAANSDYKKSFSSYSDAAIVVISRPGTEGTDYLPGGVASGTGASEPLALTQNERDIISLATSAESGFKKVIVLVNSSNPVEIGELKENDKIDSVLWIGFPGAYGTLGVADILSGKANPSGGLSDTFATYNLSAPAMMNMGDYTFSNADSLTRQTYSAHYVIEAENLYVGYRYYETRYYDCVLNQGNANSTAGVYASTGTWNYGEEVTYSFGYGLSYTTFTQEIVKAEPHISAHDITIDFTVKVTNTGDVAGKTSVQIYGQAPYTQGGIEKSAIQLLAFDKTATIPAQGETEMTISVDLQNIASYDSTVDNGDGTKGTYILDTGDYYFAVGNGIHDALNNILAKQGKTPENTENRMDSEGNGKAAYLWQYDYAAGNVDTSTFSVSKHNTKISNQLEYADWNYYEANGVTYLSRSNWQGTYPKSYTDMAAPQSMMDDLNGKYYEVSTSDDTSEVTWGSEATSYQFYQMALSDYDDERWNELLSQMTLEEGLYFGCYGGPTFPAIASVAFQESYLLENSGNGVALMLRDNTDPNAPWAIASDDKNAKWNGEVFPSAPLVGATFNPDLMKEEGEFIGVESLFIGVSILWGPGLNTHRTAYNGRNNEYYSEDPVLAGNAAMEFSIGALEYGLIAAPKHFAFNDQETNRKGVAPFMTEQRAREVELRAYQIAIEANKYDKKDAEGNYTKDVGMIGLMISFSKIGAVECTCSHGLLTDILREEWGFHGYAVTDIQDDMDLFSAEVAAGITGIDIRGAQSFYTSTIIGNTLGQQADGTTVTTDLYANDLTIQKALRQSNHDLLWAFCQSNLMNRYNASTRSKWLMTWWRGAYIAAISLTGALALSSFVLYLKSFKKEENQ